MSSKHNSIYSNNQGSRHTSHVELKPGQKQIGRNIIDPSIKTEEEDDFNDSNYHVRNHNPTNKRNSNENNDNGSDNSEEEEEIEIDPQLQENVIRYTNYYDLIKEKKKEITEIRKLMDEPKKLILQFCAKAGVNQLNVTDGKIIKNVSKKKQVLKEEIIKQAIKKKVKDDAIIQSIIDEINKIRTTTEGTNITLKRTYNRS